MPSVNDKAPACDEFDDVLMLIFAHTLKRETANTSPLSSQGWMYTDPLPTATEVDCRNMEGGLKNDAVAPGTPMLIVLPLVLSDTKPVADRTDVAGALMFTTLPLVPDSVRLIPL